MTISSDPPTAEPMPVGKDIRDVVKASGTQKDNDTPRGTDADIDAHVKGICEREKSPKKNSHSSAGGNSGWNANWSADAEI